jgi:uncharacterized membrane protein YfcA
MLTPFVILVFPIIGVPVLTPAEAVGMALLVEFFGFVSGLIGYHRTGLIDYQIGLKLITVAIPTIVVFSLISQFINGILLRLAYGVMMLLLASYLFLSAPSNVRNVTMKTLPEAVERIPIKNETPLERVIKTRRGTEYRYKVCDQRRGYLITGIGAAMEGLVSVGLGELEMPNLVKRCKIPVAVSAATSVFIIAISVLSASLTDVLALVAHEGLSAVPWHFVAYAAPGAVIGGQLGSRFQGRISSESSERFISALFTVIGIAFLYASASAILKQ